jgi:hypothetical protein
VQVHQTRYCEPRRDCHGLNTLTDGLPLPGLYVLFHELAKVLFGDVRASQREHDPG